jgi:hydrogenase-4 component F
MTFHTVAKSLLFLCAGSVYQHFKTDLFHKVKGGVIHLMPLTGTVFLMAILAIIGMPPFSLFQSEFIIVRAAIAAGYYVPSALFVLFGTGIFAGALVHVGGLILGPAGAGSVVAWHPWRNAPLLILATILVVIGFWIPAPLFSLIQKAADIVVGAR